MVSTYLPTYLLTNLCPPPFRLFRYLMIPLTQTTWVLTQLAHSSVQTLQATPTLPSFSLPAIPSLYMSHVCLSLPQGIAAASAGRNATLQLTYVAEYHGDEHSHSHGKRHAATNETFYACADITFVAAQEFAASIPCFNATVEDHGLWGDEHGHDHGQADSDDHEHEHEGDDDHHDSGSGGGKLSKEAIAGVVIVGVAGAAVILSVVFYLWRRDRREKRAVAAAAAANASSGEIGDGKL